mmetsp:Transcript_4010/g.7128  ORF Transcript_4010/g.7128 Transcript_4010/m.7128 type:complete len:83 (-) Transcript_4010:662-910(-)
MYDVVHDDMKSIVPEAITILGGFGRATGVVPAGIYILVRGIKKTGFEMFRMCGGGGHPISVAQFSEGPRQQLTVGPKTFLIT